MNINTMGAVVQNFIGLNRVAGAVSITVLNTVTQEKTVFPMIPDRIMTRAAQKFMSFPLMNTGDVKLPSGEELTTFSWEGMLPGVSRKNAAYVTEWTAPKTIQETFSRWRFFHHKLHLTITETTIDHDVYLEHYTSEQSGGSGDYSYSISFVVAKDIVVRVVSPNANTTPGVSPATPTASGKKHTVKSGESLWMIAQKYMGSGSNYPALYEMNKGIIDAKNAKVKGSKYTIYAGQVLTIP